MYLHLMLILAMFQAPAPRQHGAPPLSERKQQDATHILFMRPSKAGAQGFCGQVFKDDKGVWRAVAPSDKLPYDKYGPFTSQADAEAEVVKHCPVK